MPFRSKAQQRYLESGASPLTPAQKKDFEGATNFKTLPERAGKVSTPKKTTHWTGKD